MNQNRILENISMQILYFKRSDWQEDKHKWSHTENMCPVIIMHHIEFLWYCPVSSPSLVSPWHIHQVQPPWHILVPRTRHLWWCSDLHQWAWPWDLRYLPDTSLYKKGGAKSGFSDKGVPVTQPPMDDGPNDLKFCMLGAFVGYYLVLVKSRSEQVWPI